MELEGRGCWLSWEAGCCCYHYHMVIGLHWQPGPFWGEPTLHLGKMPFLWWALLGFTALGC